MSNPKGINQYTKGGAGHKRAMTLMPKVQKIQVGVVKLALSERKRDGKTARSTALNTGLASFNAPKKLAKVVGANIARQTTIWAKK